MGAVGMGFGTAPSPKAAMRTDGCMIVKICRLSLESLDVTPIVTDEGKHGTAGYMARLGPSVLNGASRTENPTLELTVKPTETGKLEYAIGKQGCAGKKCLAPSERHEHSMDLTRN